jgi:hypothetical protein
MIVASRFDDRLSTSTMLDDREAMFRLHQTGLMFSGDHQSSRILGNLAWGGLQR